MALVLLVPGCIHVPPVWEGGQERNQLDFIEQGVTTKEEVLAKLGEPVGSYKGMHGTNFVYRGHTSGGVIVIIYVPPMGGEANPHYWIVTIAFDKNDVVSAVRTHTKEFWEYYAGDDPKGDVIESKRRANFRRQLAIACGGHTPAQYVIAQYYDRGEGIERNKVEAFKWYSLAEPEWPEAIQFYKEKLRQEMALSEIAEAESLAAEWKPNQAGCEQNGMSSGI